MTRQNRRFFSCALALSLSLILGACAVGADRSIFGLMLFEDPEPPTLPEQPTTTGELADKVTRDGYPDPHFIPNPDRRPELSEAEREAMEADLRETGDEKMNNRVMNCGAEDPADCIE